MVSQAVIGFVRPVAARGANLTRRAKLLATPSTPNRTQVHRFPRPRGASARKDTRLGRDTADVHPRHSTRFRPDTPTTLNLRTFLETDDDRTRLRFS